LREVGAACGIGAAEALRLWEAAMWVYLVHEALGEGRASSPRRLTRIVPSMHQVGADAAAEASLGRRQRTASAATASH
jgi:hypothetical protein